MRKSDLVKSLDCFDFSVFSISQRKLRCVLSVCFRVLLSKGGLPDSFEQSILKSLCILLMIYDMLIGMTIPWDPDVPSYVEKIRS